MFILRDRRVALYAGFHLGSHSMQVNHGVQEPLTFVSCLSATLAGSNLRRVYRAFTYVTHSHLFRVSPNMASSLSLFFPAFHP